MNRTSARARMVVGLAAVGLSACALACGSRPPPTSTTPATPGSAVILPSPVLAEPVPIGDPAAPASAAPKPSASH